MTGGMIGCRVLLVEDEALIAMDIEAALEALGCVVVGPTGRLDIALKQASDEALDAAILDVTIRGGQTFTVAERLLARGIPFVMASGHGDWTFPDHLRDQPRLAKPFTPAQLEEQVRKLCAEVAARGRAREA